MEEEKHFIEWCENILGKELIEWQKKYLSTAFEIAKERKTPFIFPPRRGNGRSSTELLTQMLLCGYMNKKSKWE